MGILSDENAMCDEHYRNDNCDQCPIRMAAKAKMTSCMVYKINNEDETIKMIEDWKVKHKTLIPESLKKTLKSLYALGYRTVSRLDSAGTNCAVVLRLKNENIKIPECNWPFFQRPIHFEDRGFPHSVRIVGSVRSRRAEVCGAGGNHVPVGPGDAQGSRHAQGIVAR